MKIRKDYTCPLEIVHDLTKGKWKPIIMFQLRNGEVSLADLERRIEGISQKMLIEQLNELVAYGIVKKFGGEMQVASEWGAGASFSVKLPAIPPAG